MVDKTMIRAAQAAFQELMAAIVPTHIRQVASMISIVVLFYVEMIMGLPVLTLLSAGGFDAEGVAPVRFTDQRLRRGTAAANFQRAAGKITFSGGVADVFAYPSHRDALKAADEALYVAKAQGRNCIVYAEQKAGKAAT